MRLPFALGCSPIGLDIGPRTVAAAQLTRTRGRTARWRLEAAALIDRPAPTTGHTAAVKHDEAIRIGQVLRRQGFTGRDVVLAVPDQRLVGGGAQAIELPPRSSGAPLDQLARMEMSRAHRLELHSFEMACWEVPGPVRAAEGTHMMAVACRHTDADELIDGLEGGGEEAGGKTGLRTRALDARAWAIARASRDALVEGERVAAIVDLTESAALLAIVHDGAPAYERVLAEGALEHLRANIRKRLGIDAALTDHLFQHLRLDQVAEDSAWREAAGVATEHLDNLASELRTALAYAEHRFDAEIGRVLVQGSGAAIPGVEERLSGLLSIQARTLRPDDVVIVPEAGWGQGSTAAAEAPACTHSPALMVAVGLAMHKGESS